MKQYSDNVVLQAPFLSLLFSVKRGLETKLTEVDTREGVSEHSMCWGTWVFVHELEGSYRRRPVERVL